MSLRASVKFTLFIILVVSFILSATPFLILLRRFPFRLKKILSYQLHYYAKLLRKVIGLKLQIEADTPIGQRHRGKLIVANHLSYLDIICISSLYPVTFITSVEIKETFFLGHLAKIAGCLFVERRSRSWLEQEIALLTQALQSGLNVGLFPEATSSNGERVLSFKRPLFKASALASSEVIPVTLNYLKINEERVNTVNRDQIFWYGKMTFFSHFKELLEIKSIVVRCTVGAPLWKEDYQEMAVASYESVSSHYVACL